MTKKKKSTPVEKTFPVLNVNYKGEKKSFAIMKHAIIVPPRGKITADQLKDPKNAGLVAHLIDIKSTMLKEVEKKEAKPVKEVEKNFTEN